MLLDVLNVLRWSKQRRPSVNSEGMHAVKKKSVVPQQNKTKWKAFHVSAAIVYKRVYAKTENIIVMLVEAEVMALASAWSMVSLL